MSSVPSAVVEAIESAIGPGPIGLHEPSFAGEEWTYLKDCLDSTFVSSVGEYVNRFERQLEQFTGASHAIAVVNGTAALQVALQLVGVDRDDEVLIPALTFVATANAVHYCGATPHFVDSEESTLGIDADKLRDYLKTHTHCDSGQCINSATGKIIRALVPMHTFGHPVNVDALLAVAHDFKLALIEDAAESLGSYYGGQHTGTFGEIGTLSFNGNKTITTGGGGAILTNDKALAKRAKHLTTTAKTPHSWEYHHDEVGYNYRMPNINAALGCAQMEQLPDILARKRALHERYHNAFTALPGVELLSEPEGSRSNYWLQTIIVAPELAEQRDAILSATNNAGYMTRPIWELLPNLPPYRQAPAANLDCAKSLARRVINIPSSVPLNA